jgi:hypothetical protein
MHIDRLLDQLKGACKYALFPRWPRQFRAQILMYRLYPAVLDSDLLLRSSDCFHAVVRAVLPCSHEKITILIDVPKMNPSKKNPLVISAGFIYQSMEGSSFGFSGRYGLVSF